MVFNRVCNPLQSSAAAFFVILSSLSLTISVSAQTTLKVEHNLTIPNARTPWVLDAFGDRPQLVPLHHSVVEVNKHNGANIAGALTQSFFYKPKLTTELPGLNSRIQLHSKTPVFYILLELDQDPEGQGKSSDFTSFALVRAAQLKDKRVMDNLAYTQLSGNTKRKESIVETTSTSLADGWLRIEPKHPMEEGEYCLLPIPTAKGAFSTVVYDFGINLSAANEKDVIAAAKP